MSFPTEIGEVKGQKNKNRYIVAKKFPSAEILASGFFY
jgi:hypothetical protein